MFLLVSNWLDTWMNNHTTLLPQTHILILWQETREAITLLFTTRICVFCPKCNTNKFSTGNTAGPTSAHDCSSVPPSSLVPTSYCLVCSAERSWDTGHRTQRGEEGEGVVMGPGGQRYQTPALTSLQSPSARAEQKMFKMGKGGNIHCV